MTRKLAPLLGLLGCLAGSAYGQTQPVLRGNLFIHDPSVIVEDGQYASFATGIERAKDEGMPRTKTSPDGITWTETGAIPGGLPDWIPQELEHTPLNIWAPAIFEREGTHYLYYSASRFGYNTSVIGLMTNDAFDVTDPAKGWVDQGLVVRSHKSDDFNAIDPFRIDTGDGKAWLTFGSFWNGIQLVELDPATGLRKEGSSLIPIASRQGKAIEAPAILEHDDKFYLFVSFDQCCRGMASTYRIMVGRADAVTGPYLDASGQPMLDGGGTELLGKGGRIAAAGGQEPFLAGEKEMLVYHFYDRTNLGMQTLQIAPLQWSEDGWPRLDPIE